MWFEQGSVHCTINAVTCCCWVFQRRCRSACVDFYILLVACFSVQCVTSVTIILAVIFAFYNIRETILTNI